MKRKLKPARDEDLIIKTDGYIFPMCSGPKPKAWDSSMIKIITEGEDDGFSSKNNNKRKG